MRKKCPNDGTFWLRHTQKMVKNLRFEPLTYLTIWLLWQIQEFESYQKLNFFFLVHQKLSTKLSNLTKVWWSIGHRPKNYWVIRNWNFKKKNPDHPVVYVNSRQCLVPWITTASALMISTVKVLALRRPPLFKMQKPIYVKANWTKTLPNKKLLALLPGL